MRRVLKFTTTASAYVAGFVLVALMCGTVADVVGRYFFNAPLIGVFDLTHFAVVAMVYMAMAHCTVTSSHAAIELVSNRLPDMLARPLQILTDLAGAVIFAIIAWRTAMAGIQVQDFGQTSQLLLLPLYPLYWVVVFGCGLVAVVLLVQAVFPDLKEKEEDL